MDECAFSIAQTFTRNRWRNFSTAGPWSKGDSGMVFLSLEKSPSQGELHCTRSGTLGLVLQEDQDSCCYTNIQKMESIGTNMKWQNIMLAYEHEWPEVRGTTKQVQRKLKKLMGQ